VTLVTKTGGQETKHLHKVVAICQTTHGNPTIKSKNTLNYPITVDGKLVCK
jgi:hypothetical protein